MPIFDLPARWDRGLREDVPPSNIPPGYAEVAKNVEHWRSFGPEKRKGFKRLNQEHPKPAAVMLDRADACLVAYAGDANISELQLDGPFTFGIGFTILAHQEGGSYIYDFSEATDNNTNLTIIVADPNSDGRWRVGFIIGNGSSSVETYSTATDIFPGVYYHFRVTVDDSSPYAIRYQLDGYDSGWQGTDSLGGPLYVPSDDWFIPMLGARVHGSAKLSTGATGVESNIAMASRCIIHRLRVWSSYQANLTDSTQLDYHFADMQSLTQSDSDGNGPDFLIVSAGQDASSLGVSANERGIVRARSSARWETASPLVGSGSLHFDGVTQFLKIRDAYRYRSGQPSSRGDTSPQQFGEIRQYGIAMVVQFDTLKDCVLAHYAPVRTFLQSHLIDAGKNYYWALALKDSGGGVYEFYWYVGYKPSGNDAYVINTSTIDAQADTKYLIYATRDSTNGDSVLKVATLSSDWDEEVTGSGAPTSRIDDTAGSEFDLRGYKYAMVLGGEIKQTRFKAVWDSENDPNDFEMKLRWDHLLHGYIDQFLFVLNHDPATFGGAAPDTEMLQLLDQTMERRAITGLSLRQAILSYWPMNEGSGSTIYDFGLHGNHQYIEEEPNHEFAANESGLAISDKSPAKVDCLVESFRPPSAGGGRAVLVAAGPAVYELDQTDGTLEKKGEGLRNDEDEPMMAVSWERFVVLAGGSTPRLYTGHELFRMGLEPVDLSRIRWGLESQGAPAGQIEEGVRRYRFTYGSIYTGEESDWVDELTVEIRRGLRCNVEFGSDQGDTGNSTRPYTGQRAARLDFTNAEPFDLTNGGDPDTFTACVMDVLVEGGAISTTYSIRLERKHFDDILSVSAKDMVDVLQEKMPLCIVQRPYTSASSSSRTVRFESSTIGQNAISSVPVAAKLEISTPSLGTGEVALRSVLGAPSSDTDSGTDLGISERNFPLPTSSPQATHINVYRTVKDGDVFFLVSRHAFQHDLQPTSGGFLIIDAMTDDDLVFQPIMDDRRGPPPDCSIIEELDGTMYYTGNKEHPERLWWSVVGRFYDVPPYQYIDILDGGTLEITGLQRYAGVLLIFKEHATLVLTPSSSQVLPFRIEMRKPGVGSVGRFAIENVRNNLFIGSKDQPTRFDSLSYVDIGWPVFVSWQSGSDTELQLSVAFHNRRSQQVWFAIPALEVVLVYHYNKGAWTKFTDMEVRTAIQTLESSRSDVPIVGDSYGNVYEYGGVFSDGANLIQDYMTGCALSGTGFTVVSGNVISLTGWTCGTDDSVYVRGVRVHLEDNASPESTLDTRVLYISSSNQLHLEDSAEAVFGTGSFASGTWKVGWIDADWRSGEIGRFYNQMVQYIEACQATYSDWPSTSHMLTMYAKIRGGSAVPGEIDKDIPVSQDSVIQGFGFPSRSFQVGFKNSDPEEPFSVVTFNVEGEVTRRGRALT